MKGVGLRLGKLPSCDGFARKEKAGFPAAIGMGRAALSLRARWLTCVLLLMGSDAKAEAASSGETFVALQPSQAELFHSRPEAAPGRLESKEDSWVLHPPALPPHGPRNEMKAIFAGVRLGEIGEVLILECEARSAGVGQAGVVIEAARPGDGGQETEVLFRQILVAGPDWESFQMPLEIPAEVASRGWNLILRPGHFDQPMEFRRVRLRALTPTEKVAPPRTYAGQEPGAPWRQKAAENIARYRMGNLSVEIHDRLGRPVCGARIRLRQIRHAYPFGTCVAAARLVDADIPFRDPGMTRERFLADNTRYRAELVRLFNTVVLENDLKWPRWDESRPGFTQATTMQALAWLQTQNMRIRGHTLVWASWKMSPAWLEALRNDAQALQAAILRHIEDVGAATAPFTAEWDVLNEPMSHRDLMDLLGIEAVAEWFRAARRALPAQRLVLNEFDLVGNGGNARRRQAIYQLVSELRARGAAPDAIGCQAHFWSDRLTPPEDIWRILDEIHTATGLPILATEFDMNFPNDRLQADYTRDFLTAWFAHPATEGFIMWGFWGGAHWFGERGAMFRTDWTPKPNLEAYESLVHGQWQTRAEGVSGPDGRAEFRGFLGDYELEIERPGFPPLPRRVTITKQPARLPVVLPEATTAAALSAPTPSPAPESPAGSAP